MCFTRRSVWPWEYGWIKTMSQLHDVDQHMHDRWHLRLPRQQNPKSAFILSPPLSSTGAVAVGWGVVGYGGSFSRAPCAVYHSNWSPGSRGPEAHQMGTCLLETHKCFIILSDESRSYFDVEWCVSIKVTSFYGVFLCVCVCVLLFACFCVCLLFWFPNTCNMPSSSFFTKFECEC